MTDNQPKPLPSQWEEVDEFPPNPEHIAVDKDLFHVLAMFMMKRIEDLLDNHRHKVSLDEWKEYHKQAKEVTQTMERNMDKYVPIEPESPDYPRYYEEWRELRDLANTLYYDTDRVIRLIEDELRMMEEDD